MLQNYFIVISIASVQMNYFFKYKFSVETNATENKKVSVGTKGQVL